MSKWISAIMMTWALVASAACDKPWMFFDLGLQTIVDTSKEDPITHDFIDVKYVDGAYEYLKKLNELGYHVGLLADVPEGWGQDDATTAKVLKEYLAKVWIKVPGVREMDWSLFDPAAMFFPPSNDLRKSSGSLYLFKKALAHAATYGCPAIHQATKKKEVVLARLAGMKAYQVGVPGQPYYLPIDKIAEILK